MIGNLSLLVVRLTLILFILGTIYPKALSVIAAFGLLILIYSFYEEFQIARSMKDLEARMKADLKHMEEHLDEILESLTPEDK